jgi:dTDP-glucose pyrophosphorylase
LGALKQRGNSTYQNRTQGLPQGSAIAPILSALVIEEFINVAPHVQYADDGIFYGEDLTELTQKLALPLYNDMDIKGTHISWEKSGYVKKDGK